MEKRNRKQAVGLGMRISILFLVTVIIVISVAYYVLSQNFHGLLTNYTVKLVEAMAEQGVKTVESELELGMEEASALAEAFDVPEPGNEAPAFPENLSSDKLLRIVYITAEGTVASDGRRLDLWRRGDVQKAFDGKTAIYGPYYNEEKEYVVCYSAPVRRNGRIVGVLSIEKDGYLFCRLIENIRFGNSGESYIIDAGGTDIAVSDPNHIDWVKNQYNSRKLYEKNKDEETKSILDLEQEGLNGKSGVGTYTWNDGKVYVTYRPISTTGWVLFAGLREEELAEMTQSAFFASIAKGPALAICLTLFALLTVLIVFWIISSMKKTAEINEKLEIIANKDSLTGLRNRHFLETSLSEKWKYPVKVPSQAAVLMMDIDDFKQYNDFYGHPKGDDCLREVAGLFRDAFEDANNVMRYGGEEFMGVVFLLDQSAALDIGEKICHLVENAAIPNSCGGVVTVSVGICYVDSTLEISLKTCIQTADKALYEAKRSGKNKAVLLMPDKTDIEDQAATET